MCSSCVQLATASGGEFGELYIILFASTTRDIGKGTVFVVIEIVSYAWNSESRYGKAQFEPNQEPAEAGECAKGPEKKRYSRAVGRFENNGRSDEYTGSFVLIN